MENIEDTVKSVDEFMSGSVILLYEMFKRHEQIMEELRREKENEKNMEFDKQNKF